MFILGSKKVFQDLLSMEHHDWSKIGSVKLNKRQALFIYTFYWPSNNFWITTSSLPLWQSRRIWWIFWRAKLLWSGVSISEYCFFQLMNITVLTFLPNVFIVIDICFATVTTHRNLILTEEIISIPLSLLCSWMSFKFSEFHVQLVSGWLLEWCNISIKSSWMIDIRSWAEEEF